jgi:hypothetical protein
MSLGKEQKQEVVWFLGIGRAPAMLSVFLPASFLAKWHLLLRLGRQKADVSN